MGFQASKPSLLPSYPSQHDTRASPTPTPPRSPSTQSRRSHYLPCLVRQKPTPWESNPRVGHYLLTPPGVLLLGQGDLDLHRVGAARTRRDQEVVESQACPLLRAQLVGGRPAGHELHLLLPEGSHHLGASRDDREQSPTLARADGRGVDGLHSDRRHGTLRPTPRWRPRSFQAIPKAKGTKHHATTTQPLQQVHQPPTGQTPGQNPGLGVAPWERPQRGSRPPRPTALCAARAQIAPF